jgi:hypothetical protein
MASVIKIKRSGVSGNPSTLAAGELAYSGLADNGSNGGDRLYIGMGTETNGNAANHVVIGGKFFTDMLDHVKGVLTANSAIVVDGDSKIDHLIVDNIDIDGNTISTTDKDGNLILQPNGAGKVSINGKYTLPNADGTAGQILVTNGSGSVSFKSLPPSSLNIAGDTGSDVVNTGETLTVSGSGAISTTVTDNKVSISAADASNTTKGVASFSGNTFSVSSGAVDIKAGGVSNAQLANSKVTIGTTDVSLGAAQTDIAGLTSLAVGNIKIDGNEIASTNADGTISFKPSGKGYISANGFLIKGVADPVDSTDAATKSYVDTVATGLTWKDAVNLLSDVNVALTGTSGSLTIDGHNLTSKQNGIRVLLKNQTTASDNGVYIYNDDGSNYKLTRASDLDSVNELAGACVLVIDGDKYDNSGWVQSTSNPSGFGDQNWVQFSGSNLYTAGAGLSLTGNQFNINVASSGGIEISSNALQLKSTIAGDGLTYANGVLNAVGTSGRISVGADSIDIDANYAGQASITTVGTLTSGALGVGFTTVAVAQGGTGATSLTARGVLFGNGTDVVGVTSASTTDGNFLAEDSTGNPYWTNVIDGGTY